MSYIVDVGLIYLFNSISMGVIQCWNLIPLEMFDHNYITRCHRWLGSVLVGVSWGQDASMRISLQTEGLWPSLTHSWATPVKMRKKCCYGQKNFGSICSSLSPSPIHISHITNINPFENKVWEIYFYKEVCLFVHWSSSLCLSMFLYIFVYVLCSCIMSIQQNINNLYTINSLKKFFLSDNTHVYGFN